jgi:hypothetical protein
MRGINKNSRAKQLSRLRKKWKQDAKRRRIRHFNALPAAVAAEVDKLRKYVKENDPYAKMKLTGSWTKGTWVDGRATKEKLRTRLLAENKIGLSPLNIVLESSYPFTTQELQALIKMKLRLWKLPCRHIKGIVLLKGASKKTKGFSLVSNLAVASGDTSALLADGSGVGYTLLYLWAHTNCNTGGLLAFYDLEKITDDVGYILNVKLMTDHFFWVSGTIQLVLVDSGLNEYPVRDFIASEVINAGYRLLASIERAAYPADNILAVRFVYNVTGYETHSGFNNTVSETGCRLVILS